MVSKDEDGMTSSEDFQVNDHEHKSDYYFE